MNKLVVLRLNRQADQSGYQVSIEIGNECSAPDIEAQGFLPTLPTDFLENINEWRSAFRKLNFARRLKVKKISAENSNCSIDRDYDLIVNLCKNLAETIKIQLNFWLQSESFYAIICELKKKVDPSDKVQIIIKTDDERLFSLPWHYWHYLGDNPNAELSFSVAQESYSCSLNRQISRLEGLKILVVFGDDEGINLTKDKDILNSHFSKSHDVFIHSLFQPSLEQLRQELKKGVWDILFFSGHSDTSNGIGVIYLGNGISAKISDLQDSLKKAIATGLKLAIFNSCNGLGLAKDLQDLQIPQTIIMRELIPDKIAHEFLSAYIEGVLTLKNRDPLYLAEKYAREKLAKISTIPCADWLPTLFQNHKTSSPIKGVISTSPHSDRKQDPYEDVRSSLEIQVEKPHKACKIINPISKDSVGLIQYAGGIWKARMFSLQGYEENDTIFPGENALIVARKGNFYFVLPEKLVHSYRSLPKTQNRRGQNVLVDIFDDRDNLNTLEKLHLGFWIGLFMIFGLAVFFNPTFSSADNNLTNYESLPPR